MMNLTMMKKTMMKEKTLMKMKTPNSHLHTRRKNDSFHFSFPYQPFYPLTFLLFYSLFQITYFSLKSCDDN